MVKFDDEKRKEVKKGPDGSEVIFMMPSSSSAGVGIAYALAKAGDLDKALETAAKLGKEQDRCLEQIAGAQAADGDIARALRIAESIQQDDAKADAFSVIAEVQARKGDIAEALGTAERIHGHENDALALAAQQTSPAVKARVLLGVILGKTKAKLPKQESPK
jgi:tetratricopeptide (TPR) repeat protein